MSEPAVTRENFRLEGVPLPELPQGGLLLRVLYLSLDPYMRGRMETNETPRFDAYHTDYQLLGSWSVGAL